MTTAVFRVSRLTYRVGAESLVRDLDLAGLAGERVVLEGPSGSGKSTICRLLARRIPSFLAQHIRLSSNSYYAGTSSADQFDVPATVYIGPVPQRQLIAVRVKDLFPQASVTDVEDTLNALLLPAKFATRDVFTLSSGEAARTALAVALHSPSALAILDAPWCWIDAESRSQVADVFYCRTRAESLVESSSAFAQHADNWTNTSIDLVDRTGTLGKLTALAEVAPDTVGASTTDEVWTINGTCRLEARDARFELDVGDITIRPGRLHWVVGKNGTGKTTFARAVARLLPDSGEIRIRRPQGSVRVGYVFGRFPLAELSRAGGLRVLIRSPQARSLFAELSNGTLDPDSIATWATNPSFAILGATVIQMSLGRSVIVIDEPFADSTASEVKPLTSTLRQWATATNTAIILISHLDSPPREDGESQILFHAENTTEKDKEIRRAYCVVVEDP